MVHVLQGEHYVGRIMVGAKSPRTGLVTSTVYDEPKQEVQKHLNFSLRQYESPFQPAVSHKLFFCGFGTDVRELSHLHCTN